MKQTFISACIQALLIVLAASQVVACGPPPRGSTNPDVHMVPGRVDPRCEWPGSPEVITRDGHSVLLVWELEWRDVWFEEILPENDALAIYREGILAADAVHREPVSDPPEVEDEYMREVWRREYANQALAYSGEAGTIRPVQCIEALFLAYQSTRFPELTHPTEFIAALVRREDEQGRLVLKAYFAASDSMFPPKAVYPFDAVEKDVEEGWTFWSALHNHTVQTYQGAHALGVPVPSTNDVMLSRSLAEQFGLQHVLVTNGFFTIDIPAALLDRYEEPPQ